ncbi:MAG: hypothetical protein IAC69_01435 [Proteobacteria bacterium]|uniref:IncF plasmid conjugative transfer protein TraN n=1 Tax=Candidatus Enterousia avistercoris TaxID=2840788 RepID=A0A9D9GVD0_9PROT|nr:hypothetical protein [Candidatus Enterousia avistercoris]
MKKLLLIFSICCINGFAYAGACTPILCDETSYDVSEMLTEDGITGGSNNNDDRRFSSKLCYMCDTGGSNSQCDYGDTVVIARPGGQGTAFQCVDDAGVDDSWQQIPESALCTCGDSPLSQMDGYIENAMLSEIRAGQCNRGSVSNVISQTGPQLSVCRYRECMKGYKSLNGNMCVPETAQSDPEDNNEDEEDNNNNGGGAGPNQCEQTRCNGLSGSKYNECVACCHVSSSVANWNGSTCICAQNASYLFVPNSDPTTGGQCYMHGQVPEVVVTPDPGYECDPVKIAQIMGWQVQYASNATISGQILAIIQYCDGNPNEITFNTMYNQLLALINQESAAAQLSSQQAASRRRIANAASDIRSVVDNLDVSKWRTAEGNFNTSRLLSDSIAGVVLGTAGGLITSNVMKKNQASNGLEDIQCTVGGQVVAGWGDQFQVGIH